MGGVPRNVVYVVRMGTREDASNANLHLMVCHNHLLPKERGDVGGTNTLFRLPNPDDLVDTHGG
jgi:hypothetical protein